VAAPAPVRVAKRTGVTYSRAFSDYEKNLQQAMSDSGL
jgi:hypothetical protein